MATPRAVAFSHQELAEILVKQQGIRKGHWGLSVRFGLSAANIMGRHEDVEQLCPAAVIPVLEVGIRQFDEPNSFTVDASKVGRDPVKKTAAKKTKAKKSAAKKKPVAKKKPKR